SARRWRSCATRSGPTRCATTSRKRGRGGAGHPAGARLFPFRRPADDHGPVLSVRLLGPFAVEMDGRPVPPGAWERRDASGLVKLLALRPERRLHREQVMELMWPDLGLAEAAPRLHKAAHYARRALGRTDALVLRDDVVALLPGGPIAVDADEFERTASAALAQRMPEPAAAVLDRFPGAPL